MKAVVITPHVINTLRSLPMEERLSLTSALASEMILGATVNDLAPMEDMIYSILRNYVKQASDSYNDAMR